MPEKSVFPEEDGTVNTVKLYATLDECEDRNTPINLAKAIIEFSMVDNDIEIFGNNFLEMVEYLNVKARHVRNEMQMTR